MDDLAGLKWSPSPDVKKPPPMNSVFSGLRSAPVSGRSSPFSGHLVAAIPPSKSTTPANDNFANSVSFSPSTSGRSLSLLEKQRQLAEQKAREEAERNAGLEAQYGGSNAQFWNNLEQIGRAPSRTSGLAADKNRQLLSQRPFSEEFILDSSRHSQAETQSSADDDDDDILAAFNASAPVDASTNFPVPVSTASPSSHHSLQFSKLNMQQPTVQDMGFPVRLCP